MRGRDGQIRIGNERNNCATCNNFVQNVMRLTRKLLMQRYPGEYAALRMQVEADLYPQVIEDFNRRYPKPVSATS